MAKKSTGVLLFLVLFVPMDSARRMGMLKAVEVEALMKERAATKSATPKAEPLLDNSTTTAAEREEAKVQSSLTNITSEDETLPPKPPMEWFDLPHLFSNSWVKVALNMEATVGQEKEEPPIFTGEFSMDSKSKFSAAQAISESESLVAKLQSNPQMKRTASTSTPPSFLGFSGSLGRAQSIVGHTYGSERPGAAELSAAFGGKVSEARIARAWASAKGVVDDVYAILLGEEQRRTRTQGLNKARNSTGKETAPEAKKQDRGVVDATPEAKKQEAKETVPEAKETVPEAKRRSKKHSEETVPEAKETALEAKKQEWQNPKKKGPNKKNENRKKKTSFSNLSKPDVTKAIIFRVSGASGGSSLTGAASGVNGDFVQTKVANGKPFYKNSAGSTIQWEVGTDWGATNVGASNTDKWTAIVGNYTRYYNEDDSATPPLSGWMRRFAMFASFASGTISLTYKELEPRAIVFTVSGAGGGSSLAGYASGVNGDFVQTTVANGKPFYKNSAGSTIAWEVGTDWGAKNIGTPNTDKWTAVFESYARYYNEDDAATPPVSGWMEWLATGNMSLTYKESQNTSMAHGALQTSSSGPSAQPWAVDVRALEADEHQDENKDLQKTLHDTELQMELQTELQTESELQARKRRNTRELKMELQAVRDKGLSVWELQDSVSCADPGGLPQLTEGAMCDFDDVWWAQTFDNGKTCPENCKALALTQSLLSVQNLTFGTGSFCCHTRTGVSVADKTCVVGTGTMFTLPSGFAGKDGQFNSRLSLSAGCFKLSV